MSVTFKQVIFNGSEKGKLGKQPGWFNLRKFELLVKTRKLCRMLLDNVDMQEKCTKIRIPKQIKNYQLSPTYDF